MIAGAPRAGGGIEGGYEEKVEYVYLTTGAECACVRAQVLVVPC
jgi:hypothetical protein